MSFARRHRREGERKNEAGLCKFCGGAIAMLPSTATTQTRVYHSAPPCAEFIRNAEARGGKLLPETMNLDELAAEFAKEKS